MSPVPPQQAAVVKRYFDGNHLDVQVRNSSGWGCVGLGFGMRQPSALGSGSGGAAFGLGLGFCLGG
eukprot:6597712-Prymnesium_polylepis.2